MGPVGGAGEVPRLGPQRAAQRRRSRLRPVGHGPAVRRALSHRDRDRRPAAQLPACARRDPQHQPDTAGHAAPARRTCRPAARHARRSPFQVRVLPADLCAARHHPGAGHRTPRPAQRPVLADHAVPTRPGPRLDRDRPGPATPAAVPPGQRRLASVLPAPGQNPREAPVGRGRSGGCARPLPRITTPVSGFSGSAFPRPQRPADTALRSAAPPAPST